MDIQNVLVYIIVACCLLWTGRHFFRTLIRRKGKSNGCGCGCSGCNGCPSHKD